MADYPMEQPSSDREVHLEILEFQQRPAFVAIDVSGA
jgi:hypothetical protein